MDGQRWRQIDTIFRSALERPHAERAAFLDEACRGDAGLRREVESLLAHDQSGSFMQRPVFEDAARLLAGGEGESLAGRTLGAYKILEKLGEGGMGVVYRATDERLGRTIALKLLPSDFTADAERLRRFEREARHASALNHPNILTVHDIGREGGLHFIATEFVEGETLRSRLSRGALPVSEALDIAAQTADALEAAHEAKIIHRDIKPENVMIRRRDGYVKILDFGLAKLSGRGAATDRLEATTALATAPGVILGTVPYMSPEQARGLETDARTDIWSLGVVLYEMLAGCRPFDGETGEDVRASILRDEPRALPDHVPEALREIVVKALRKPAGERYQSAAQMLSDLRALKHLPDDATTIGAGAAAGGDGAGAAETAGETPAQQTSLAFAPLARALGAKGKAVILVCAVAALVTAAVVYFRAGGEEGATIDSVAVLPFQNVSGDPDAEYFSDGVTESLINSLSELPNLKVMSRNSVFRYKGRATDAQQAARQLGVRAVLTGRVVQRGDDLSISVELMDAQDNSHLWGAQYNRKLADIFAVQEEITKEISEKLRLRLSGEEKRLLTKRYTENTEAYQLYLKCNFYWHKFTPEAARTAVDFCTQAIIKDPNFALPYEGLARSYGVMANNGWVRPHDVYPKAKAAVAKARELDPNSVVIHDALAAMFYDWDWAAAESGFKRTIEIEPNNWASHELYSYLLSSLGRHDEAIAEIRRAQEIDPLSLIAYTSGSIIFYHARQYDRALEQARKTLELDAGFPLAHQALGKVYVEQRKYEEAIAAFQQAINLSGRTPNLLSRLGHAYAVSGQRDEALKILAELKEMARAKYVLPHDMAILYTGLGDKEQALKQLELAYQERNAWLMFLKVEPVFDPLRSDPRFQDLLRRMNLAP